MKFLLIIFVALQPAWGPFKFDTAEDCRVAASVVVGYITDPVVAECRDESGHLVAKAERN